MDGNTALGIALIIMQTGWGVAAWKAAQAGKSRMDEHEKKDEANFNKLFAAVKVR